MAGQPRWLLGVSKAGFYAWSERAPSARQMADGALLARMQEVHAASRHIYGAPRVHAALRAQGERHGRKRIARLMREAGLSGCRHRKGGPTTTRQDEKARPAPDLVDRRAVAVRTPNGHFAQLRGHGALSADVACTRRARPGDAGSRLARRGRDRKQFGDLA